MPRAPAGPDIAAAARRLLASGAVGDASLRGATTGDALPVVAPGGAQHSWFVPFTTAGKLAAFAQLKPDGELLRFSTFQRRPGDLAGCPEAADWLDTDRIRARALTLARGSERAGDPLLSFDRNPDRLAWSVPLTGGAGTRHVWVAGAAVYEAAPAG